MKKLLQWFLGLFAKKKDQPQVSQPPIVYLEYELTDVEYDILDRINAIRSNHGLRELQLNQTLCNIARSHSVVIVAEKKCSHNNLTYRAQSFPHYLFEENVCCNYSSAGSIVNAWMTSPKHKDNIMDPRFNLIGIAVAKNAKGNFVATAEFVKNN